MAALTREQQSRYDIAKWRWRADLFDFDAALYDQIGKPHIADQKRAQAAFLRGDADATEAFENVCAEHGGGSPEGLAAALALREWRQANRTDDLEIVTLDGYNEPTPEELGVI